MDNKTKTTGGIKCYTANYAKKMFQTLATGQKNTKHTFKEREDKPQKKLKAKPKEQKNVL